MPDFSETRHRAKAQAPTPPTSKGYRSVPDTVPSTPPSSTTSEDDTDAGCAPCAEDIASGVLAMHSGVDFWSSADASGCPPGDTGSAPGFEVFDPVLAAELRYSGLNTLKSGDRVRVRLTPPLTKDQPRWVPCVVQDDKTEKQSKSLTSASGTTSSKPHPPLRLVIAAKKHLRKWIPTQKAKFFGNPTLDVDIASVPLVTEAEYCNMDALKRTFFDSLKPDKEVAVCLQYAIAVRITSSERLGCTKPVVDIRIDDKVDSSSFVQWQPGTVGQRHVLHHHHGVYEVNIPNEFIPASEFKGVSKRFSSQEFPHFDGDGGVDVFCYDFERQDGVSEMDHVQRLLDVVEADFGWSKTNTLRASGGRKRGHGWCLLKARKISVDRLLDLIHKKAPWCRAVRKSQCTLGFLPAVVDPRKPLDPNAASTRAATAMHVPGNPLSIVTVFTRTTPNLNQWSLSPERAAALLSKNMHALNGFTVKLPDRPEEATVISYLPQFREFLVQTVPADATRAPNGQGRRQNQRGGPSESQELPSVLAMVDLLQEDLRISPTRIPVANAQCFDPLHMRFGKCTVCLNFVVKAEFPSFCYRDFRISGDGAVMNSPRHPNSVCQGCMRMHCDIALSSGQLFVPCPAEGCGRTLQTMELQYLVSRPAIYAKLLSGLKDVELSGSRAFSCLADLAGLDLRQCPTCAAAIEKNEGCSMMRCYRCGAQFSWDAAPRVKPSLAAKAAAKAAAQAGEAEADLPPILITAEGQDAGRSAFFVVSATTFKTVFNIARIVARAAGLIVPIGLVVWLCARIAYSNGSTPMEASGHMLRLTPIGNWLWSWLPLDIQNGACTALPWPTAYEQWCLAPCAKTVGVWAAYALDWLSIVYNVVFVAACGGAAIILSPLADDPAVEHATSSRCTYVVVTAAGLALMPILATFSDTIWEYSLGEAVTLAEFVGGHVVSIVKFVVFDHAFDVVRVATTINFVDVWCNHARRLVDGRPNYNGHPRVHRNDTYASSCWTAAVVMGIIAPSYFTLADVVAEAAGFFTRGSLVADRWNARAAHVWDTYIEPVLLWHDGPDLRGVVTQVQRDNSFACGPTSFYPHAMAGISDVATHWVDKLYPEPNYMGSRRWLPAVWLCGALLWCRLPAVALFYVATIATKVAAGHLL